MQATIKKWGNSPALRISSSIMELLAWLFVALLQLKRVRENIKALLSID